MAKRNKYNRTAKVPRYIGGGYTFGIQGNEQQDYEKQLKTEQTWDSIGSAVGGIPILGGFFKGIAGKIGGQMSDVKDPWLEKQAMADQYNQTGGSSASESAGGYTPTFCSGGKVKRYPKGGMTSPGTAELERREVFMTPDGNVQRISDKAPKHGQKAKSGNSGVRMDLPEGTKILSNREIDPMTGKTFAFSAKFQSKMRDKAIEQLKGGNKYAKKSAELNLKNLDKAFNSAFDRQEAQKANRSVGKYAKGGEVPKYAGPYSNSMVTGNWANRGGNRWDQGIGLGYTPTLDYMAYGPNLMGNQLPTAGGMAPNSGLMPQGYQYMSPGNYQGDGTRQFGRDFLTGQSLNPGFVGGQGNFDFAGFNGLDFSKMPTGTSTSKAPQTTPAQAPYPDKMVDVRANAGIAQGPIKPEISLAGAGVDPNYGTANGAGLTTWQKMLQAGKTVDWGNAANTAATIAPAAYNIIQGLRKPEQRDPSQFKNPEYGKAIDLMANRRFDVEPLLEANRNASRIGRYNLANAGASAGQQYSGYQALAAQRMRGDQAAYTQKQNIDNQYMAQEAQMRAGLGSEEAQNRYRTDQDNLAAQAMKRQHMGTGIGQVSQYAQVNKLMQGQEARDRRLEEIIKNYGPYAAKWAGLTS